MISDRIAFSVRDDGLTSLEFIEPVVDLFDTRKQGCQITIARTRLEYL
jgi:hypothetical protein